MAKSKMKKAIVEECFGPAPTTLDGHPFYGLELDDDQKNYVESILNPDKLICFCNAAAGTGKTLLAVAAAELLCKHGAYDGIVYIAAPTQEQKQGYLAGSLEDKSEPYFTPFYQACDKLGIPIHTATYADIDNQKNGTAYIECMTHTFLRGTTFDKRVIIVDESQNYYFDELLKTLTRIADSCKTIVIGHDGQIDLYKNAERSGFATYMQWFKDDPRTAICHLTKNYRGWVSNHADACPRPY